MKEIYKLWKDDIYISNFGNVKGRKILNDNRGYYTISYKQKKYKLHRLVAELFIPNPENKREVDHIDTNKLNNNINNLRWVQPSENMNNPLTRKHIKEALNKIKKHDTVFCIELNLYFNSTRDACKYLNLEPSHSSEIRMACRHGWKSHGYHWQYVERR